MAINSYTMNLPKDRAPKTKVQARPGLTIPSVDVNVVVEALQDKHLKLVKTIDTLRASGKGNMTVPLDKKLATVRRLLDAANVGWKIAPEIPPEVLAQREGGRFWNSNNPYDGAEDQ